MKDVWEIPYKQVKAFKGASLEGIDNAMTILEAELNKLSLIKRAMIAEGKQKFDPKDFGIEEPKE